VAFIVTVPVGVLVAVLTVKLAEVLPALTVTVPGIVIPVAGEGDRAIAKPPVGAGPEIVSFPVEEPPGRIEVGFSFSDDRLGGSTVSVAV
jgi:hypothetical protein